MNGMVWVHRRQGWHYHKSKDCVAGDDYEHVSLENLLKTKTWLGQSWQPCPICKPKGWKCPACGSTNVHEYETKRGFKYWVCFDCEYEADEAQIRRQHGQAKRTN